MTELLEFTAREGMARSAVQLAVMKGVAAVWGRYPGYRAMSRAVLTVPRAVAHAIQGMRHARCIISALLLSVVVVTQVGAVPAAAAPQPGFLQTISDFLSLGANTVRELQDAIRLASSEAKSLLEQINADVTALLAKVSDTYQENLYITIDSLDQFTRNKLLELQSLFEQVAEAARQIVAQVTAAAIEILRQASVENDSARAVQAGDQRNWLIIHVEF